MEDLLREPDTPRRSFLSETLLQLLEAPDFFQRFYIFVASGCGFGSVKSVERQDSAYNILNFKIDGFLRGATSLQQYVFEDLESAGIVVLAEPEHGLLAHSALRLGVCV